MLKELQVSAHDQHACLYVCMRTHHLPKEHRQFSNPESLWKENDDLSPMPIASEAWAAKNISVGHSTSEDKI